MKKTNLIALVATALLTVMPACASTSNSGSGFDLKDIVSGGKSAASTSGDAIAGLIEGVFATSNLEVKDLAGEWTIEGSAVQFQSEDFLKKAGGAAAAGVIEGKLDPYYKKLGLTGGVMTVQVDGTFTLKLSKMTLNGNITKNDDGNFTFSFTILGQSLAGVKTYVSKSTDKLDVMFDANKLISILQLVAKFSGSSLATTATSLLGSYDGMCVGFGMKKTGKVEGEETSAGEAVKSVIEGILKR